jgi:hypothetical protein
MAKFMGIHTFPKNAFSHDQVCKLADAAQHDPAVKGYRSFLNLAEGKAVCVMEAKDKDAVVGWFKKMGMPTDLVVEVEMEGDCGNMQELKHEAMTA